MRMKILFDNYVTLTSSEASYMNGVLSQAGIQSMFWSDKRISTFDMLDSAKPDVLVTHYRQVTQDLVKYLSNQSKIDLVLNISGVTGNEIKSLEQLLDSQNIKCKLMFSGDVNPVKPNNIKFEEMLPAADIFFPFNPPSGGKKIDYAVVCQSKDDLVQKFVKDKDVYHVLGVSEGKNDNFDLPINVKTINDISQIYNQVVLTGDIRFVTSQLFYDCVLRANKCSVITNPAQEELWDKHLKKVFNLTEKQEEGSIKEVLRAQVMQKHTAVSRASRLMKLLGNSDGMKLVENFKNNIGKR